MTTNYNDDDYDDSDTDEAADSPRGLRRAASKSKKLESENNELRRELAFAKAGIPMDDPKMRYFVKGYEGELTADAIREAAMESGFLQSQQGPDPAVQAVSAAEQRVMQASAGAVYEDASEEAALSRLEAAMQEGGIEALLDVARQFGIPTSIEQ